MNRVVIVDKDGLIHIYGSYIMFHDLAKTFKCKSVSPVMWLYEESGIPAVRMEFSTDERYIEFILTYGDAILVNV